MLPQSLARRASVTRHKHVVLLLPRLHVLRRLLDERALSLLGKRVLICEALSHGIILFVILLVLLEDLGILGQVLLIRQVARIRTIRVEVGVLQAVIDGADIVMVHSVLDVLEIVMSNGHAELNELVLDLALRVLNLVFQEAITVVELLTHVKLSHLVVDLGKLLHLEVVLTNDMLLSLSHITQVVSRRAGKDLTRRHSLAIRKVGTGCKDSEALDNGAFAHSGTHTNIGEGLELTLINLGICSNVDIITDGDSGRGGIVTRSNSAVVLQNGVLADADLGGVAAESGSMPGRGTFTHGHIADEHRVGCDPVRIESFGESRGRNGNATKRGL